MVTKFNTGDSVLIPGRIVSAKDENGLVSYEIAAETFNVPEELIEPNTKALGTAYRELLKEIDQRY